MDRPKVVLELCIHHQNGPTPSQKKKTKSMNSGSDLNTEPQVTGDFPPSARVAHGTRRVPRVQDHRLGPCLVDAVQGADAVGGHGLLVRLPRQIFGAILGPPVV